MGSESDLLSSLHDAQKAARSKFFSVIFLPFQEHQDVESVSFHQLSVFLSFFYTSTSLSDCTATQVEEIQLGIILFFILQFVNYYQKASGKPLL